MERAADREAAAGRGGAAAEGSRRLTRGASAWLAGLAFVLAFLTATATGGQLMTALLRGAGAAGATLLLAPLLVRAALSTVLDAIARDRAESTAAEDRR